MFPIFLHRDSTQRKKNLKQISDPQLGVAKHAQLYPDLVRFFRYAFMSSEA